MRVEAIFSWLFFIIGAFAVVSGLKNNDTWMLCLGILLWVGSNFLEIMINRDMICKVKSKQTGGKK